jgi:IS5 family transposase
VHCPGSSTPSRPLDVTTLMQADAHEKPDRAAMARSARIEPVYPKPGNGRPPVGVERMLRMYFLQHWFNLSDPAVGEALYDSPTLRAFVGIDFGQEPVPDETTVCKFRHLLEEQGLGQVLFDEVTQHLRAQGLAVSTGTIVDATIIAAPSSTKNATGTRDPGMHRRGGNGTSA